MHYCGIPKLTEWSYTLKHLLVSNTFRVKRVDVHVLYSEGSELPVSVGDPLNVVQTSDNSYSTIGTQ
jgi:hypothetical protein